MQWTDQSSGGYGADPYDSAGDGYDYACEHDGGTTTGMAATPRASGQLAQGTYPAVDAYARGTDLYGAEAHVHDAGPGAAATVSGVHGDVLTVDVLTAPAPGLGTPGDPTPGAETPFGSDSVRPVFVDSSGRRQRRVRRAARLLVIPAGGYVALLISAVLGGPRLSAPFVPQPDSPDRSTPRASVPDTSAGTGDSAESTRSAAARKNSRSTAAQKNASPTERPTAPATTAATPVPTTAPTSAASPTSSTSVSAPAPAATPAVPTRPTPRGRALGTSHKPVR
ncbi:hypothetical protein [Streptomyces collinus]|uniref:Uncharacterized protein n=1 Tax=Streptomyces collinus TaxID=42684 RepID=B0B4Y2_STRCU|nr:hypothetical protein [Streptomyces collinus]CAN89611.1 hypothetical protein orf_L19 [Streptomyces collinus Tu 365]